MTLYVENAKDSPREFIGTNKWIQRSSRISSQHIEAAAFLYTSNTQPEKEITKIIPLMVASERIKYLGINLTKEVKDLYNEIYETFLKEVKEGRNK